MAISVGGLISGIDTQGVVEQLTELERRPITKLQQREAAYQVQLTSYGSLRSALADLRSAASALNSATDFNQFKGVSSNEGSFTASVFSTAHSGSTSISVQSLAQVHKIRSEAFGVDEGVGEGTFTLRLGEGDPVEVTTSAEDTLADVAHKINAAQKNILAAVITDGDKAYLTLTGQKTGEANTIRLEVTPPPPAEPPDPENPDGPGDLTEHGGLSRLTYIPGGEDNQLTETQAASDAVLTVDGVQVSRETNVVADVVRGVTLTLHGTTDPERQETLTVNRDTAAIAGRINAFVDAYNALSAFFREAQNYDPKTQKAGILQGDSTANIIRNRLSNAVAGSVSAGAEGLTRISDLGITLDKEGKLQVDGSTLSNALQYRFDDVKTFFSANKEDEKGFGVAMVSMLDRTLSTTNGELAVRTKGIQTSVDRIEKDIQRYESRISRTQARLQAQFENMERLLGQYQQIGDFLTQQLQSIHMMNQAIANRK